MLVTVDSLMKVPSPTVLDRSKNSPAAPAGILNGEPLWLKGAGVRLLLPRTMLDYAHVRGWLHNLAGAALTFALIALLLFHGAHRLQHSLYDLGWRARALPKLLCCGSAALASATAAWLLVRLGGS